MCEEGKTDRIKLLSKETETKSNNYNNHDRHDHYHHHRCCRHHPRHHHQQQHINIYIFFHLRITPYILNIV